jgi:murein DD-endopeptidase MepM/ murein hydrolase activator NlpD
MRIPMRVSRIADRATRNLIAAIAVLASVAFAAVLAESALRSDEAAAPRAAVEPAAPAVAADAPADRPVDTAATPPVATPAPALAAARAAAPVAAPAPVVLATFTPGLPDAPTEPEAFAPRPTRRTPTEIVTHGELRPGDTLASAMARANVPPHVVHLVASRTSEVFDFRHAQPGHRFDLTQDLDGRVLEFRYHTSSIDSIELTLVDGAYVARRAQAELTPRVSRIAGVVNSSLYGAMLDLGEQPRLANDFTNVFAWDVDFSRTVQHGDEFRVLYERLYYTDEDGNEVYAGPGRILAARYGGAVGEHTAVYFETEEGSGGYYRPDGTSMERQFLLAPLSYSRISSRYTSARRHPILKITRPHHGIDYAAKRGAPVWSVADGEVIYRGWAGGFGNLVKIRHANGYVSYYAHLSKFASRLRVGDRVQQKQVVGFVGSTGLATGPHVCFRVAKDGRYVNPARVPSPAAKPIPAESRAAFAAVRDTLLSELNSGSFVATKEAL